MITKARRRKELDLTTCRKMSAADVADAFEMLRVFLKKREGRETFQQFTVRHDLNTLQAFFSNDE